MRGPRSGPEKLSSVDDAGSAKRKRTRKTKFGPTFYVFYTDLYSWIYVRHQYLDLFGLENSRENLKKNGLLPFFYEFSQEFLDGNFLFPRESQKIPSFVQKFHIKVLDSIRNKCSMQLYLDFSKFISTPQQQKSSSS